MRADYGILSRRILSLLVVATVGLTGCGGGGTVIVGPGPSPGPTPQLPPLPTPAVPIRTETFVAGAAFPVSLVFAPDGRLFYNELQTGNIRIVSAGGQLQAQPFATVSPLATAGEQGLLGLALDPDFANNRFVYVYHTHPTPLRNRVIRFTESGGVGGSPTVIVDNLPVNSNHNGGRLAFGPDGRDAYLTVVEQPNDPPFTGAIWRVDA